MLTQLSKTELTGIIFEIITGIERSGNTPDISNVTNALASAFTGEYDVSMAPDIIKYMLANIEIEK